MGSDAGPVEEVLSESAHTRVVRLRPEAGYRAIRKEPLGPDAAERVSHEIAILRRLSDVAHVAHLAPQQPDARSILLEDVGGVALARVTTPLDPSLIVRLMLDLARVVADMHQHGVVHGDINPGNILLADGTTPYLIDFALATTFAELRPEFLPHQEIVGTLPYLAPEQTGRTGRSMDRRADLYALGATMYELATGAPPFGTGDPLRLIHDHLTRTAVPPAVVNPAVPAGLSAIVMHLLEKEPDNRYQTAEGVCHDLELVREGVDHLRVGEHDVPPRLTEPSHLVGRDREIDALRAAFEGALAGECRRVVVSGESGVGKSALIDELRPIAAGIDGWFASGRYDRHRQDQEHDGVVRALRNLGRLLLAEPEDELVDVRLRLRQALGPNAGLAAAVLPEFATLLKVSADPGDPLTAQDRSRQTALEIMRAVASRKRPVAFVVDDLQWAGTTSLGFIDQVLSGNDQVASLLMVVAYREDDVPAPHPLAALRERWLRRPGDEHLRLTNLDRADHTAMVREMLHARDDSTADLAAAVFDRTRGNPYDTVELLNGLRREGVLWPTATGWQWDPATLDRRLAREGVLELVESRVAGLPAATREVLEAMASLGGDVQLSVLGIATGLTEATLQQRLAPALDEGLLVMLARGQGVRFHHDRLRDAVLSSIDAQRLRELRLSTARRLARWPELFATAVDQYLPVVDALDDPSEQRHVASLLRDAAGQHELMGESGPAERMLAAAPRLTDDPAMLVEMHTSRLAALVRLGRLEEADDVYETVIGLSTRPQDQVEATRVQISSLTHRGRNDDAIRLGFDLLHRLGWALPTPENVNLEIDRALDWCRRWIAETGEADDLGRPDVTDPAILAVGALLGQMMAAGFLRDQETTARLALAAARLWAEKGPANALLTTVGNVSWVLIGRRQDYRAGHSLLRRLLAVGEARGFEPGTSMIRFIYSLGMCHWFDPLEEVASYARAAREGLIRAGDLQGAAPTFLPSVFAIDLAPTVDAYGAEIEAAVAFAERTGSAQVVGIFEPYRWLAAALRGEPTAIDGETMTDRLAGVPVAAANAHVARALAAAMLDDAGSLARHSEAAMALEWSVEAMYPMWQAHLLRAIALADQLRTAPGQATVLAELDGIVGWIRQRAADAPTNFLHLLSLVAAERAWAVGDFRSAIHSFDSALRAAGHRPWHRAYIAERSAKFMLAHGLDHAGWSLLVEAREGYRAWGASAKVEHLDRAYPSLDTPTEPSRGRVVRRTSITSTAIDMLAILEAARSLSSETSVGALRAKVADVLSGMTGATDVQLLVWRGEQNQWLAATQDGDLATLDEMHRAPDSVIRYVERTREPLIVGDVTRDDRFARDPYFIDVAASSLLAVPVLSRGALRAVLVLENRLIRDAFPAERLEGVMLIAGQLGVSLDNALIYSSLERKVAERTEQLGLANERLAQLSITDPLTGLANRRRLEESLGDEWRRSQRTGAPVSLAMVDIDHFKWYNDRHGHREGDRCLQRVADQIRRTVRDTDLVARYGGEEFAVVMPHTGDADAWEAAERIRLAISAMAEPLTDETVVTVSVGVATLHDADRQSIDQVLERADAALYQAKRAGRNRVHAADAG